MPLPCPSFIFVAVENVPLIVPEINGKEAKKGKLLANPNCTTAIALMALWPLYKEFGLKKVIMSTYQAASGAGAPGMNELKDGVEAYVKGDDVTNDVFAHPLPFNVIPHIDVFQDNMWAAFPLVLIRRIPCPAFSLMISLCIWDVRSTRGLGTRRRR